MDTCLADMPCAHHQAKRMDAFFGMLFLLLTPLYHLVGLLPSGPQAVGARKKIILMPHPAQTRQARQSPAGTCAELSPERSWFRLLANGWPVPVMASPALLFFGHRVHAHGSLMRG